MKPNRSPGQTARVDNQGSEMMSCTPESQAMQLCNVNLYTLHSLMGQLTARDADFYHLISAFRPR